MKKLLFLMSLGLMFNLALLNAQDIINPTGVTMSLPNTLNTPPINIVNGSGLSDFPSITATHENNSQSNSLLYFNGVNIIDFDLGGSFDIEGFAFWNATGPAATNFGVKDVIISASQDGVSFTSIPGSPTVFAEATNGPILPETFSFNAVNATHIRIEALNNHGDGSFTGISEVAFIGTSPVVENVINPVSATSTLASAGTDILNTLNGTGLVTFPSLSANHDPSNPGNSWVTQDVTGTIDFDLGGSYLVDGFSFWNQNAGGPGADGTTGIKDVMVYSSTDGAAYTLIPGSPTTFAQITTTDSAPEMFDFTALDASFIRIEVLNNHGDVFTGFAEVAFSGTPLLGISENTLADSISLYPNPARDVITINNASNVELKDINVYDINGRLVQQQNIKSNNSSDHTLNVSELTSGIYMVQVIGNQSNTVKRLIKQ